MKFQTMTIFRDKNSLYHCVKHLGLKNGWKYWRLDSYCRKNPDFVSILIDKTRKHIKSLDDGENKQIGLSFVDKWEKGFEQWKQKN